MKFHVLTLFPEMITQGLNTSITGKALDKGLLSLEAINIRDYTLDKHRKVDDYPYGGGAGMVMAAEPVYRCYQAVCEGIQATYLQDRNVEDTNSQSNIGNVEEDTLKSTLDHGQEELVQGNGTTLKSTRVVYLTPQGKTFNQSIAQDLAKEDNLIFLCGHYEGIDERVLETIVTDYVSIGDYVLTGGELPAMVMIDAISRLVPGVLNNETSAEFESFQDNLLEYPQYTRPIEFLGKKVPDVLLSGHHKNVEVWRKEQSIIRTYHTRPDLLEKAELTKKEKIFLENYKKSNR